MKLDNEKKEYLKSEFISPGIVCAIIMIFSIAVWFINQSYLGSDATLFFSLIILQLVIIVIPAAFYVKLKGIQAVKNLQVRFIRPNGLWITIVGILVVITGSCFFRMIAGSIGYTTSLMGEYYDIAASSMENITGVIYSLLTFVLVPALCEEFVFRGVIFSELRKNGSLFAIVFSSALWAFSKFNISAFIIYFFVGIIMASIICVTKSILSSLIIHIALNYSVLMFEKYLLKIVNQSEYRTLMVFVIVSAFLISLLLLFSEGERYFHNTSLRYVTKSEYREIQKEKREKKEKKEKVFSIKMIDDFKSEMKKYGKYIITPSCAICLVLYIVGCILK